MLPLLLGAFVGLVLGLLGGGGSVLAIPFLTYALGMEAKPAVATSLLVVGSAACVAALVHARAGNVRSKVALTFGLLGALGAMLGSQLARLLPGTLQLLLFAGIMLLAGRRMLRPRKTEEEDPDTAPARGWTAIAGAALATGVLTGVVGVGGGFLIVPALLFLVGLPMREAVGTSLLVIVMNAAGGIAGYLATIRLDLDLTLPFVIGAASASALGSWLGQRIAPGRLRAVFGAGVVVVALGMLAREGYTLWTAGWTG